MPQGMQIWNASGDLILDVSNRLGRVLGVVTLTAGTPGSASNAGLATGTPFWVATNIVQPNATQPDISVSGTTISWTWPSSSGTNSWRLVYGVY